MGDITKDSQLASAFRVTSNQIGQKYVNGQLLPHFFVLRLHINSSKHPSIGLDSKRFRSESAVVIIMARLLRYPKGLKKKSS